MRPSTSILYNSSNRAYAFGSTVKERTTSFTISYKFSMNTQEKEPELGEGVTSAEFWVYDGKLGRRWNVDPEFARYPWFSSYMTFGGNPVLNNDINGDIFGLSTKKQRTAAKEASKITGGKVNKWWSKNINVTWTVKDRSQGEYKEGAISYDENGNEIKTIDPVVVKAKAKENRRQGFAKDGSTLYTQRLRAGEWKQVGIINKSAAFIEKNTINLNAYENASISKPPPISITANLTAGAGAILKIPGAQIGGYVGPPVIGFKDNNFYVIGNNLNEGTKEKFHTFVSNYSGMGGFSGTEKYLKNSNNDWVKQSSEVSRSFGAFSYQETTDASGKIIDKGIYIDMNFSVGLGLFGEFGVKYKLHNIR